MDWTGWIAIFALIMAIFAIIVIVVAIYIFQRDNELIRTFADRWAIVTGSASSPDTFQGAPESIYTVNSAATGAFILNITAYANISSGVTTGFTTEFIIDNTTSNNATVTVTPVGGISSVTGARPGGVVNPATVAPGTSARFIWLTPTTIKRLS